jgi:hypothetical protein
MLVGLRILNPGETPKTAKKKYVAHLNAGFNWKITRIKHGKERVIWQKR